MLGGKRLSAKLVLSINWVTRAQGAMQPQQAQPFQIAKSLKLLDILRKLSNGIFGMFPDFVHKIGF